MTGRPNICLIGCGGIGAMHAKQLRNRAVLSFCSRSRGSAEAFRTRFGGVRALDSVAAALESDADAVVIASPPAVHAEQVVGALRAGKAVLVEKPLCVSPQELAAIGKVLSEVENPLLMVAENYYYKPSLARIRQTLGFIGPVRSVQVKKLTTQRAEGWKRDYGALLEGGVHFVALISDLFDAPPVQVEAVFPGRAGDGPERESIVRLTYADGAVAQLHYSWQTRSLTKSVFQHSQIEGERGRIVFESNGLYVCLPGARWPVFPGLRDMMGYGAMMRNFLACLADRARQPHSNFERAKRDLQIVFEAYRSL